MTGGRRPAVVCLYVLAFVLASASSASAWSVPRTVSSPHTSVGPLWLANGPFAAYAWQDGIGKVARTGATAAGPAGEVAASSGLVGVGRYALTRAIALSQTLVSARAPQRFRVAYAFGSIARGFGAPRTLAITSTAYLPQLSVAPNGAAHAAWIQRSGNRRIVRVDYRPAGGRFGAPYTILGRGRADVIAVAIGAGNDLAVLAIRDGKLVARLHPRLGHWGPVQTLASAHGQTQWLLAAAIDPTGEVQAVWRRHQFYADTGPSVRSINAAAARRDHPFGHAQTLASDLAGPPVVISDAEGWAVAYPLYANAGNLTASAIVQIRHNGKRFGPAIDASPPSGGLRDVSLAADTLSATLLAGWIVPTPTGDGGGLGYAALRPFDRQFAAPQPVTPDEAVSEIAFTATSTPPNAFTAAWIARPGGTGPGVPLADLQTVVREATQPAP